MFDDNRKIDRITETRRTGNERQHEHRTPPTNGWAPMLFLAVSIAVTHTVAAQDSERRPSASSIAGVQRLIQSGDLAEAERSLRALAEKSPNDVRIDYLLGFTLHGQERYADAIEYHLKAASIKRYRASALYNLACTYAQLDEIEQCIDTLKQAVKSGYRNRDQMMSDPDLKALRKLTQFQELIPPLLTGQDLFHEPVHIHHTLVGESANSEFGWIARACGDLDNDRHTDFFVTAPSWNRNAGKIYAYSGRSAELLWSREGKPGERLGHSGAALGDANSDQVTDLIIGAPYGGGDRQGRAYVLSGKDGTNIQVFQGRRSGDEFGNQVTGVGDIDDDGIPDAAVAAWRAAGTELQSGRCHVFSTRTAREVSILDGKQANDAFGSAVAGCLLPTSPGEPPAALLVVGAQDAGQQRTGLIYVYRLTQKRAELAFQITGRPGNKDLGKMFASFPGDFDQDGIPDIYVSDFPAQAPQGTGGEGMCAVYSGADGRSLLTIWGTEPGGGFGTSPSEAGDVDGDGIPDLVVGAWNHSSQAASAGRVSVHSGVDGRELFGWTCRQAGDTFGFDACRLGRTEDDTPPRFLLTAAWSAARGNKTGRVFIVSQPASKPADGTNAQ